MELDLFLPQMRMTMDAVVERAQAAEAAGFGGIAFMDHLAPPLADGQPMLDAMVTAAWVAARTTTLRVGHLVLCDAFRHPVVLAKEAVSLDHASGGRFDLGIGWGSVPTEFTTYGVGTTEPKARVDRLTETLEVLERLWSGEPVSYDGHYHQLIDASTLPTPIDRIPVLIGGVGPRTLGLVRRHADWWNIPLHRLADLEVMREKAGDAKVSVQIMVAFVPPGGDRDAIVGAASKRFGYAVDKAMVIGDAQEVVDAFGQLAERGVERTYCWFTDFAAPATLEAFGEVIAASR